MARTKKHEIFLSDTRRSAIAQTGARLSREFWMMPEDVALDRYLYAVTQQFREADSQRHIASGALDGAKIDSEDEWDASPAARHRLQNICRNLYLKDPIARNIINNHVFFVYGSGPVFQFGLRKPDQPDSPVERAHQRFSVFSKVNDLGRQLKTAITMTLALGEYFLIEPQMPDDDEAQDFVKKHGILGVRGIEPTRVQDVLIDPFDLISPVKYVLTYASRVLEIPGEQHRELDAERVMHMKVNAFGVHGRPILEPVVHYILRANDMLEDRVAVSNTRARLPVIREIRRNVGAPARELPERGTVLTVPMDRERWNFPSLGFGSSDFDPELASIYHAIAQGVGLPEVFVTMDLLRAGAFGQLAPVQNHMQRLFESYQQQLEPVLLDLAQRVCPWIDPDQIRVDFPKPDFLTEQMKVDLADRKLRAGLISKRMAIESIGEEPERVFEEIRQESASGAPPPSPGPGGSALGQNLMGSDLGLPGGFSSAEFTTPRFPATPTRAQPESPTGFSSIPPRDGSEPAPEAAAPAQSSSGSVRLSNRPGGVHIASSVNEASELPARSSAAKTRAGRGNMTTHGSPAKNNFQRVYAGMDFGWDNPGAVVVLGKLPDGRLLVMEEVVKSEMQLLHAREPKGTAQDCCWVCTLKSLDRKYGLDGIFTDPKDPEAVSVMREHFNIPVEPVTIPVADGVENMKNLALGGRLFIDKSCAHLLTDAERSEGHALDALRYSTTAMLR